MESPACEARPTSVSSHKADVEEEQQRKEIVGHGHGDGSTDESPFELLWDKISRSDRIREVESRRDIYPDKEPIDERIEGSTN